MSSKLNKIAKMYQQVSLPAAPKSNKGKQPAPDAVNGSDTPDTRVVLGEELQEKQAKKEAKASKKG